MPVITTYKCDRCSKEQPTSKQMWEVGVLVKSKDRPLGQFDNFPNQRGLWCRKCVVTVLGAIPESEQDPEDKHPEPLPTLEDRIREIIHDEMGQNNG